MGAQDGRASFGVHYVGLARHAERELGHVLRFAIREIFSVQVWFVVLTWTSTVLKGLKGLAKLFR